MECFVSGSARLFSESENPDPRLFMTETIQEPEKSNVNNGDGVGRVSKKRSCDGGIKPNERQNEEKLGCKLSLVWFGDGKIVRQDYPLKSP